MDCLHPKISSNHKNLQKYARSQDENMFHFMSTEDNRFERIHTVIDNIFTSYIKKESTQQKLRHVF